MKNSVSVVLSLTLVLMIALGCSLGGLTGGSDSETTKDSTGKRGDSTEQTEKEPSGEVIKVGIPECDELATYINDNSEEIEGSLLARGIVYVYKNMILNNVKESVEKMSEEDKKKVADACAKSMKQLKEQIKK